MRYSIFLFTILLFTSCSSSGQGVLKEVEWQKQKLAMSLARVETVSDFRENFREIERGFVRLVEAMIEFDRLTLPKVTTTSASSQRLEREMERICALEGGRVLLEEAQRLSLHQLDRYHREKGREKDGSRKVPYDPLSGRNL